MLIAGKPYKDLSPELTSQIKFISPNLDEVLAIARVLCPGVELNVNSKSPVEDILKAMTKIGRELLKSIDNVLVTLGEKGVLLLTNSDPKDAYFSRAEGQEDAFNYQSLAQDRKIARGFFYSMEDNGGQLQPEDIVNVSGAGDSFTSGFVTGMIKGLTGNKCIWKGMAAARCALRSQSAVPKSYELCSKDMPVESATGRILF